ncbi:MAG: tRNA (N6-isopentenyl adenosine(37)-C2)-methylthiotransferase MiaB, partial [Eubacteriales bacterium]|nr:tRNA (N6-isopentenyl adenosine(37)-C2)-methylthiotransferase MiaB [Eubacteriales bacterium]
MIRMLDENSKEMQSQQQIAKALFRELSPRRLTCCIESYGCQMNAHDSERILGMLQSMGFTATDDQTKADMILFNTCCVREHAEKRVFGNVGALKKRKDENPGLIIAVCGCMMQQKEVAERLHKRFPFVNLVFGTHSLHELPSLMQQVLAGERPLSYHDVEGDVVEGLPAVRSQGVFASVNTMYGCNNFCSYCIVPYVRGRERSRKPENIINEVTELTQQGYSEIMLLGQNVNSYGNDSGDISFPELLRQIDGIPGLRRLRFMTSHPKDLSDGLIEAMKTLHTVCHHIHLPVQSGSDRILKAMNRKYTRAAYLQLVQKLRAAVPDVELTTDIIVGFPGETEADFHDTLSLIDTVGFAAAFTFMYSPRAGTKAANMPEQIGEEEKKSRLLRLNALQEQKTKENNLKYIGSTGEVLVEGCDTRGEPMAYGKFGNFKMVYFPGSVDMIGTYQRVTVEKAQKNSLIGR